MLKTSNNLEWRSRKICHLISITGEGSSSYKNMQLPMKGRLFIMPVMLGAYQKALTESRKSNTSLAKNKLRDQIENEIKAVRINLFWGTYMLHRLSEFAFICCFWWLGEKEKITARWRLHLLTLSSRRHATIKESTLSQWSTQKQWNALKMPQIIVWMFWWANWRWALSRGLG